MGPGESFATVKRTVGSTVWGALAGTAAFYAFQGVSVVAVVFGWMLFGIESFVVLAGLSGLVSLLPLTISVVMSKINVLGRFSGWRTLALTLTVPSAAEWLRLSIGEPYFEVEADLFALSAPAASALAGLLVALMCMRRSALTRSPPPV